MNYSVRTRNSAYTGDRAVIYCRLSKDDEREGESASIEHQRELLTSYCLDHGFTIVGILQDDGYTGTNQNRPGFQELLRLCGEKKVDVVVTKDLSRLGRDYLGNGELIEKTFPKLRIRYIAVNDSVDSMNGIDEMVGFKNMINECYSRDTSKKVHSGYMVQAKNGKFTGCVAPFGYKKSPEDNNKLIIDEETAPIIRKIFGWAYDGHGINYICRRLEEEKIPCPTWWNRERGIRNHYTKQELKDPEDGKYFWDQSAMKRLLGNPVYRGAIAGQRQNYQFKVGVLGEKKPEEWIVVEDMCEPIIDKDTFDAVQKRIEVRKRVCGNGEVNMYAGICFCGECGRAVRFKRANDKNRTFHLSCGTYGRYGVHHCTQHRVDYDVINDIVLKEIKKYAKFSLKNEDEVLAEIKKQTNEEENRERKKSETQIAKQENRLKELDKMMDQMYSDKMNGRLSETNFYRMMENIQDEQKRCNETIEKLREMCKETEQKREDAVKWRELIQQYRNVKKLDRDVLHHLIKRIVIHENIDAWGIRSLTIEIHFNFLAQPDILSLAV